MTMQTIGQLVKKSGLSRSTLLYYDRIGLLKPSGRSAANYRLYTTSDIEILTLILEYRAAGISLADIQQIIQGDEQRSPILEQRLMVLNSEMLKLRTQQLMIVQLLKDQSKLQMTKTINKQQWVNIMQASGMDELAMRQWHIAFEESLPQAHSDFLESLGISAAEIALIKAYR